ncbi:MAG: septal ring lytic transglycosylase RlpA family protein [Rickettsiales bacterium]|nr:septal ring lytic transglycosylase RlpA family protein [Rickettsiales bacterium]
MKKLFSKLSILALRLASNLASKLVFLLLLLLNLLLLNACEEMSSEPNLYKSNRNFSNIDKISYNKSRKKSFSDGNNISSNFEKYYEKPDSDSKNFGDEQINHGYFKVGNPYQVQGVSYFPQNYEEFEETGIASWYGNQFHGRETANGEIYDSSTMTAAHPTLPLPSMIRVTNLRNGKSVILRVNDRGPFVDSRVIDVSEKAAEELGFKDYGTTEVRIQLLRDDTDQLLKKLKIKN